MKSTIPGLLIVGLLAGPITAPAAVTFTTDTATDLIGTFSVSGTSVDSATPSVFDFGLSFCMPVRASRGTTATVGLQCAGSPDNPGFSQQVLAGPQSFASVSGMTSSLAGSVVPTFYFLFSDLQDTGGTDGTFSGAFCFSRSSTGCTASVPEPEPATLGGFYPPVAPPAVATNLARAGKTIPLTFYAETASGPITNLTTVNLTITGVTCESISTAVSVVEEYVPGQAVGLQNLGGGYYQYNWKTRATFCKASWTARNNMVSASGAKGRPGSSISQRTATPSGVRLRSPSQRMAAAGYPASFSSEIIYGSGYPQTAFDWWMSDPTHRNEILNANVTEMGIAYAYNSQTAYGSYFTVDFASP